MLKFKVMRGKIAYSDSRGRRYIGPLKDAPDYVVEASKNMDRMMQAIDDSLSHLDTMLMSGTSKEYTMSVSEDFGWKPVIFGVIGLIVAIIWLILLIIY